MIMMMVALSLKRRFVPCYIVHCTERTGLSAESISNFFYTIGTRKVFSRKLLEADDDDDG